MKVKATRKDIEEIEILKRSKVVKEDDEDLNGLRHHKVNKRSSCSP